MHHPSRASLQGVHRWESKPWLNLDEQRATRRTTSAAVSTALIDCCATGSRRPLRHGGATSFGPRQQRLYLAAMAVFTVLALELSAFLANVQKRPANAGLSHQPLHSLAGPGAATWTAHLHERRLPEGGAASHGVTHASRRRGCGPAASHESHEEHGNHQSGAFTPIVFFIIAYISSAVAQEIMEVCPPSLKVPHSVNLFLIGMLLARTAKWIPDTEFGQSIRDFMNVDPHIIFWVLLPAILYEDSSGVNWHVMKKVLPSAILLAIPGVILNALLTGAIVKFFFGTIDWAWDTAFLMGSILSATDPVAVMSALHQLHAPDQLSLLISGESLVNDGSAVVIFSLFWESARKIRELTPLYSAGVFVRMTLGGPVLGLLIALIAFWWLKKVRKFNIEIIIIMLSVFASFFLAEHPAVKVSGVLAVVVFGFFHAAHGHLALNIAEEHRHHAILEFVALLSNEAVFVLAGVVGFRFMDEGNIKLRDWLELLMLYFIVHMTRALVMVVCMPLLSRWGYGLRWKEAFICVYGGLRGAVGLAMALMVEHDHRVDVETRSRIAFHTSGIVLCTLLVNGTSISWVYHRLQMYQVPLHHEKLLILALRKANVTTRRLAAIFEGHWFFHNCHFADLWRLVPNLAEAAEHLEKHAQEEAEKSMTLKNSKSMTFVDSHSLWDSVAPKEKSAYEEVNSVLSDISYKIGSSKESPEDRFMRKLRHRRKHGKSSNQNVFNLKLVENAAETEADTHHQVIELALQMAREEQLRNDGKAFQSEDKWSDLLGNLRAKAMDDDGGTALGSDEAASWNRTSLKSVYSSALSSQAAEPADPEIDLDDTDAQHRTGSLCSEPVSPIAPLEDEMSQHSSQHSGCSPLPPMPERPDRNDRCTQSLPPSMLTRALPPDLNQQEGIMRSSDDDSANFTQSCSPQLMGKRTLGDGESTSQLGHTQSMQTVGFAVQRPSYLKAGLVEVVKRPGRNMPPPLVIQEAGSTSTTSNKYNRKSAPTCAFSPEQVRKDKELKAEKEKKKKAEAAGKEVKKGQSVFFDEEQAAEQVARQEKSETRISNVKPSKVRFSCPADVAADESHGLGHDLWWDSEYMDTLKSARSSRASRTSMAHKASVRRSQMMHALKRCGSKRLHDAEMKEMYDNAYCDVKVQAIAGFLFETRKMNQLRPSKAPPIAEMTPRERAMYRWKMAKLRVLWALKKIAQAHKQREMLFEDLEVEHQRSMASIFHLASDQILSDANSSAEIYHTVLSATRVVYKAMYRAGCLDEYPYSILLHSLEFQEEACNGELRKSSVKPIEVYGAFRSESVKEDPTNALYRAPQVEQMVNSFAVAWQHICRKLRKQPLEVFLWFEKNFKFCSGWTVAGEWWFMRRDIELVLAYVITHDQLSQLAIVKEFQHVEHEIRKVAEKATVTVLYDLMTKDEPMFAIFEHVLCARLMICAQRRLLNEMVESGVLAEHDADHLISKVIDPRMDALDRYTPSKLHLSLCRDAQRLSQRKGRYSGVWDIFPQRISANFGNGLMDSFGKMLGRTTTAEFQTEISLIDSPDSNSEPKGTKAAWSSQKSAANGTKSDSSKQNWNFTGVVSSVLTGSSSGKAH